MLYPLNLKRNHPEQLARFRVAILGLVLVLVTLEALDNGIITKLSVASIVCALSVLLPSSILLRVLLAVLGSMLLLLFPGSDGLNQVWAIAICGVTGLGKLLRNLLLGIEWELASREILGLLLNAETASTPNSTAPTAETILEQALTCLRDYVLTDAILALRQLDPVTAEAVVCLPATALPEKQTHPKLFTEALEQNRCLYYPDYPSTPGADPVLVARGTQSIAVLPISSGNLRGAILLIWDRRTHISSHQQQLIDSLLGGLRTLLWVSDTTFRFEKLESRYSSILETIPQGVVFLEESGEQGWLNQTAAEQLGLDPGAVEPHTLAQAMAKLRMSADNQAEIAAQSAQFFSKPLGEIRDWLWVFTQPQPLVLSLSSTPIRRVRNIAGRLWLVDNITEQYFSRLALAERTAQLEAANEALRLTQFSVDRAADAIFWIGQDAKILYVNEAACLSLGYSSAELLSMLVHEIDENFTAETWSDRWRLIKQCGSLTLESQHRTKNGRTFPVEVQVNFLEFNGKESHCVFVRDITQRKKVEQALRSEQEKTERLLLNILPQPIAQRLKRETRTIADSFSDVTILFADIVGFTKLTSGVSSSQLVFLLNEIFSAFDDLTEKHGLEKIKTVGDAYMVVGGLPTPNPKHGEAIAEMALDMLIAIDRFNILHGESFSIRIGINSGSVVAGVIGTKKFIYDLWGDAVNVASRMESHGIAGKIQVTEETYKLLRDKYLFQKRGRIPIKGKGEMATYLLTGRVVGSIPILQSNF
jgi:PAS domain S-box-containing protein